MPGTDADPFRRALHWLTLLTLVRVPVGVATLLVGIGAAALLSESSTMAGPFEAETGLQVGLLTALAVFAGWHAVFMLGLTWTGAAARFALADPPPPRWVREARLAGRVGGGVLLALPIIVAAVRGPEGGAGPTVARVGFAALGVGFALTVCAGVAWLAGRTAVWRVIAAPLRWAGPGYWDPETDQPVAGHVRAAIASATFLSIYAAVWLGTQQGFATEQYAAGIFALIVVMLVASGLAGATYFLDRFRVPVLAATALVLVGLFFVWDRDHSFPVAAIGDGIDGLDVAPRAAAAQRIARQALLAAEVGRPEVLIIGLAHGGGIQAAAWTATSLRGLESALGSEGGPHFRASLGLLSSASGGSVGLLHYLDRLAAERPLDGIVEDASRSSLGAVLWGFLFPDLASIFVPFTQDDRGTTLEAAWRAALPGGERARLSGWGRRIASGRMPAVVFNATVVETGRPVWITPLALEDERGRRLGIEQLYAGRLGRDRVDLDVVTAARLSASFAFISPAVRPRRLAGEGAEPGSHHLVDGGYFDNAGAVAAIEWLRILTQPGPNGETPVPLPPRIALVELVPFPEDRNGPRPVGVGERLRGLQAAVFGPGQTIFNARGSSQAFRADREIELMRRLHELDGIDVRHFEIRPPEMSRRPPLSWHLTPADQARNAAAWDQLIRDPCSSASRLARFVSGAGGDCPAQ